MTNENARSKMVEWALKTGYASHERTGDSIKRLEREAGIVNHWGVWVDKSQPTTGVYSNNNITWEFLDLNDAICLECEESINAHGDDDGYNEECPNCAEWESYCIDYLECDSSHTRLHGDWIQDDDGKYKPDIENPKAEFAMIENESTCQVVWSKYIKTGLGLCSPCYPGQADVDSSGDFIAYVLPDWALYKEE